jgi:hypothetical protein
VHYTNNVAVGSSALQNNIASNQTAVGFQTLYYNTIGGNNTAHGYRALHNNTTVVVALGTITGGSGYTDGTYTSVLMTHVSGSTAVTYPTATIVVAGGVVTTVTLTSFGIGFKDTTTVLSAAAANIGGTGSGFTVPVATISSGDNNTAIGLQALYANKQGDGNTATGTQAMYSSTTASNNTAIGLQALYSNTTGGSNSAVGSSTLYSNTTGANNVAVGMSALQTNTTGANNSAVGRSALYQNTTGSNNTSVGIYSSEKNTTGTSNAALGYAALYENTTGSSNTAIGRDAGRFIADGTTANTSTSNSVFLGYNTKALATGQTNQIVIGESAVGLGSNTAILGNSSITKTQLQGNVGIGTATPAQKLDVNGNIAIASAAGLSASNQISMVGSRAIFGYDGSIGSAFMRSSDVSKPLVFGSGTSEFMRIVSSSGNVGIGTTGPLTKLHTNFGTLANGDVNELVLQSKADGSTYYSNSAITGITFTNWINGYTAGSLNRAAGIYGYNADTAERYGRFMGLSFYTSSLDAAATEKMRIDQSGKVGIGTTSPVAELHVNGSGNTGYLHLTNSTSGSTISDGMTVGVNASNYFVFVREAAPLYFGTNATERMRITSDGNVGIGTASPSAKLDVVGNIRVQNHGEIYAAGTGDLFLGNTNSGHLKVGGNPNDTIISPSFNNLVVQTSRDQDDIIFKGGDSISEIMRIDTSAGNVGIGTTSPKNKLDIVGSLGRGAPVTKTTDFTVAATENWLIMNGTATITITLPTASSFTGRELMIKNIAAYTVISASSNVKPIDTDNAATAILPATAGSWCTLVSDGTNWVTMMN